MKKALRYLVPVPLKKRLKWLLYSVLDLFDVVTGKRDKAYPPRRLNYVGSADFKAVGDEFATLFKELGELKASDRVLDVGSGIGRMAIPLTSYLTEGSYQGFDIDRRGVAWCQQHITPAHPQFEFQFVDLYNQFYNAKGSLQSDAFVFPYADNAFDFVFATSVFTHLIPKDAAHYLDEIERVLAPGGRAFLTWFVLDDARMQQMRTEVSNANFAYALEGDQECFYSHRGNPEAEIAYTKTWLAAQLKDYKVHSGTWCGEPGVTYQDVVIWQPKK